MAPFVFYEKRQSGLLFKISSVWFSAALRVAVVSPLHTLAALGAEIFLFQQWASYLDVALGVQRRHDSRVDWPHHPGTLLLSLCVLHSQYLQKMFLCSQTEYQWHPHCKAECAWREKQEMATGWISKITWNEFYFCFLFFWYLAAGV